jgi:Pol polyprotein
MSDQSNLFRDLKSIKCRTVKVGGGVLYANHIGTAELVCLDGSSMLLADCLYVPGLGVNILSGRRLCEAGLKGAFNDKRMYFKNGKKTIVRVEMREGLYIVTNVAKGYEEKAFTGIDISPKTEDSICPQPVEELSKSEQERYMLWHRRFSHLNPQKIRNLHKISTLAKPIKVPTNWEPCKVCALMKMKNRIPKELTPHKQSQLALIQLDIAGPLPIIIIIIIVPFYVLSESETM